MRRPGRGAWTRIQVSGSGTLGREDGGAVASRLQVLCLLLAILGSACGRPLGSRFDEYDSRVVNRVNDPPTVSCPDPQHVGVGGTVPLYGGGSDDRGITHWRWRVVAAPEGSTARPEPATAQVSAFTPTVIGDFVLRLTASDAEGLEASCQAVVSAVRSPVAFCPADQEGEPGVPVLLEGDGWDDEGIVAWSWELVGAPQTSAAAIQDADRQIARLTPDVVGLYVVRLTVLDRESNQDSCELTVRVGGPPVAICPDDRTVPTRTEIPLHGEAFDDGWIIAWHWAVLAHDTDTDPVLAGENLQDASFWALRVGTYQLQLTVTDDDYLTDSCELVITTTPGPPTAICPATVETLPLRTVTLTGEAEDDGSVVAWRWELVSRPTGSSALPPAPADAPTTYFTPDLVGEYVLRLLLTDDHGNTASCDVVVRATPGRGLRVELWWNPPYNPWDSSDVDLHLLHPAAPRWFHDVGPVGGLDCFYDNCNTAHGMVLDWEVTGYLPDNPRLDLDDVDGFGPENTNITEPVTGQVYTVGVHYYDDHGWGPAQAHLRVYCGQIEIDPVLEIGPRTLYATGYDLQNSFWKVAEVTWNGIDCAVTPLDVVVTAAEAMQAR